MLKPLLLLLAGLLWASSTVAQVELAPDHPERYVVQRGDTLWDIASRFLTDPWLWPEIWAANPQIDNPHLIYPGDVISLSFVGGQPRLTLQRGPGDGTVKLSPRVRRSSLSEAIRPIDLDSIRPFLDARKVLGPDELDGLAYVVAIQEGYLVGTVGQRIYVRDLRAQPGETYAVVRPTVVFRELPETFPYDKATEFQPVAESWGYPSEKSLGDYLDDFWRSTVTRSYHRNVVTLGYEVRLAGIGEVVATGDPSTLLVTSSVIEIQPGDLVIPAFTADLDLQYFPHAATDVDPSAAVIGLSKTLFGAGRNQVVAINRGSVDGIEHGHVLSIRRPTREIRDRIRYPMDDVQTFFSRSRRRDAKVELPEEYAGHLMVFKTFDRVSYGLIVRSAQAIKIGDVLGEP